MTDFEKLKPDQLGTLYDSFKRTVKAYPNNPALRIPKKKDREYYPEGFEITWKELRLKLKSLQNFTKHLILALVTELQFYLIKDLNFFTIT